MSQETFESKEWGTLTFYPVKGGYTFSNINKCCSHCMLHKTKECKEAPCRPCEREDNRLGYYSIHQMPETDKV